MHPEERTEQRDFSWLVWLEPVLVALLAPAFLFPSPARSFLFPLLLLIFLFHFISRGKVIESSPVNTPLALLLMMVLVSIYATPDIAFSVPKVAGVLIGAAICITLINWAASPQLMAPLAAMFVLGGTGLSLVGMMGTHWFARVPALNKITANLPELIKGIQGAEDGLQPNAVAGGLTLFIPLQISLLLLFRHLGKKWRLIWAPLFVSLLITLGVTMLTQSRGGWFGLAIGILLLIAWKSSRGRSFALAVSLVGCMAVFWLGPAKIADKLMSSIGSTHSAIGSIQGRMEFWRHAVYGISDFPFTGMGLNSFRRVVNQLYPLFLEPPDRDIAHCHNQLLQTALDLGIPGLVASVALLSVALTMGVEVWRRSKEPWIRAAAQGLVCGIVAQQVFGITDAIALGAKIGIFFWVTIGLLAVMHRLTGPGALAKQASARL